MQPFGTSNAGFGKTKYRQMLGRIEDFTGCFFYAHSRNMYWVAEGDEHSGLGWFALSKWLPSPDLFFAESGVFFHKMQDFPRCFLCMRLLWALCVPGRQRRLKKIKKALTEIEGAYIAYTYKCAKFRRRIHETSNIRLYALQLRCSNEFVRFVD